MVYRPLAKSKADHFRDVTKMVFPNHLSAECCLCPRRQLAPLLSPAPHPQDADEGVGTTWGS